MIIGFGLAAVGIYLLFRLFGFVFRNFVTVVIVLSILYVIGRCSEVERPSEPASVSQTSE